jgi:hypothetical protein
MQVYLDRETYDKTIAALLAIEPDSLMSRADAIKLTLGEVGDIWPDEVREDAEAAGEPAKRKPVYRVPAGGRPVVESHHQLDDSGVEFIEDDGMPIVSTAA